jgi:alpha-mannosidase
MQPPMPSRDAFLALRRFQTFFRDVVERLVYPTAVPIEAEVFQIQDPKADPITPAEASRRDFRRVQTPWPWGPKWSTAWFRVRGTIPSAWQGLPVVLRFSPGTEAQVWRVRVGDDRREDTALQGLDVNRDAYRLAERAAGGEPVEAIIEAACNHPFGVTGFEWDAPEVHQRWNSATPGLFDRCELAVWSAEGWELRQAYAFALKLLEDLPLESNLAQHLIAGLREATNAIPQETAAAAVGGCLSFSAPLTILHRLFAHSPGSSTRCLAVGHAHLDTAWLWPIRETKRKVLRTFSNQLRNMERFPAYAFLASQTQHYAWVEERDPALFEQIKARVAEGRWEPGGGMWIEPDVNCVSGESLVRQILHADRWWRSRFGERGRQRFLYLPDTFGFGSNLPQIMRLAGLDTFITNKLHWWQHTTFPYTTFVWRGIDGSRVLAHNTPGGDYNATNTPKELRKGEANHREKSLLPLPGGGGRGVGSPFSDSKNETALWLQPFGFGDGGGGATDWSIRFAQFASDCEGVPRVEFSTTSAFCDAIHNQHRRGVPFPEWIGELDMEIHRGTYTTQAWIKRANRDAEESLRLAELLSFSSAAKDAAGGTDRLSVSPLDTPWKLTLLNQFHDILPGSSIGWVYEDARRDYEAIRDAVAPAIDAGLKTLAAQLGSNAVLNPTSRPFSGVLDREGTPVLVRNVPALGAAAITPASPATPVRVAQPYRLEGLSHAALNPSTGTLAHLALAADENLLAADAGLVMFEDRPIMWDAWDLDAHYRDKPISLGGVESCRLIEDTPLRAAIETVVRLSPRSRATIRTIAHADSPRVDLQFLVDWHEKHTILRFEIPTTLGTTAICTHSVHFGHQTRLTHRNTDFERARFEFPTQGWLDLSEQGRGLALLADCKYGFSCWHEPTGHRLGVSLLRSPTHPDPHADEGRHEFTISLLAHEGDWRAAGVIHHAEILRTPPRWLPPGSTGKAVSTVAPFTLDTPGFAAVEVSALKPAADDHDAMILRLHECHGAAGPCHIRWHLPIAGVVATDLLERTEPQGGTRVSTRMTHADGLTRLDLRPFEIVTLRASRTRKNP